MTDTDSAAPTWASYHTATPYLVIRDAARAIAFYTEVFGATELRREVDPGGKIGHAEIKIGDSPIMLADEFEEFPAMRSPQALGGSPAHLYLVVADVDAVARRAVAAGATELMPVADQRDGDRRGGVRDPFGHIWWIATHTTDSPPADRAPERS